MLHNKYLDVELVGLDLFRHLAGSGSDLVDRTRVRAKRKGWGRSVESKIAEAGVWFAELTVGERERGRTGEMKVCVIEDDQLLKLGFILECSEHAITLQSLWSPDRSAQLAQLRNTEVIF